ncbi:MAG: hypothetical protein ACE5E5_07340 [Phycisphaerae bacterium]
MAKEQPHTGYAQLVRRVAPASRNPPPAEHDLDLLLDQLEEKKARNDPDTRPRKPDPIEQLRKAMLAEYIPIFVELSEKYAKSKIALEMDASNLLQGGREIKIAFSICGFRTELLGTVTNEAIAFHETHYTPDTGAQIASGPLLGLRRLNAKTFRDFICSQLAALVRTTMRQIT